MVLFIHLESSSKTYSTNVTGTEVCAPRRLSSQRKIHYATEKQTVMQTVPYTVRNPQIHRKKKKTNVTRLYHFWHSKDCLVGCFFFLLCLCYCCWWLVIWTSKSYFPSPPFYCSMCTQLTRSPKTAQLFAVRHIHVHMISRVSKQAAVCPAKGNY